ncbi:MAG TPA: pantetheine-phosphate adenylyltransferase [Oscillospiraceae bacterium]|nr:pantetheine-phosphate adenylyltransferase [Oscillospiraceae bacterium]HNY00258.1 pantetheine-phosphate adenylyltransferase [Oscillospiraceae bacterium]HPS75613.1 pantetheine-phosphate adenylyltransferase [Oscillospiraceae bacterium]
MSIAIYPGSFDPVTRGHLDIIKRAAAVFDRVVVCVMVNAAKADTLFTLEERRTLLELVTADMKTVTVDTYSGLLTEYARLYEKPVIIRGLRAITDFDYEFQISLVNKKLNPDVETLFLIAGGSYTYLSSSAVRELGRFGAGLGCFVPDAVARAIYGKFSRDAVPEHI